MKKRSLLQGVISFALIFSTLINTGLGLITNTKIALAASSSYTLDVTSTDVNDFTVTVSGTASADPYGANSSHQFVSVDWGNGEVTEATLNFTYQTPPVKTFTGTWSISYTYPLAGSYPVSVMIGFNNITQTTNNSIGTLQIGPVVSGCTDITAFNYDPLAIIDNGSCIAKVFGCTDPAYVEYNTSANVADDTLCITPITTPISGCMNPAYVEYNASANIADNSLCVTLVSSPVPGCTVPSATNYNSSATIDDGTCTYAKKKSSSTSRTNPTITTIYSAPSSGGQVLGASIDEESSSASSTEEVIPQSSLSKISFFARKGYHNDQSTVETIQKFLNQHLGLSLVVDGEFGDATESAVKSFQTKYIDATLAPWGITEPTGIVYLTTLYHMNKLIDPQNTDTFPKPLIPFSQNPNTPKRK